LPSLCPCCAAGAGALQIETLKEMRAEGKELNDEQLAKVSYADEFKAEVRPSISFILDLSPSLSLSLARALIIKETEAICIHFRDM
jgi:hypothetical protein